MSLLLRGIILFRSGFLLCGPVSFVGFDVCLRSWRVRLVRRL